MQVLVLRELAGTAPMSQGEFVRLLGGDPHREGISPEEQREIVALGHYWANQIRNNIRPILADYFGLMVVQWEGNNKPVWGNIPFVQATCWYVSFQEYLYAV